MSPTTLLLVTVVVLLALLVALLVALLLRSGVRTPTGAQEPVQEPVQERQVALPVDTDHPPTWKVYQPRPSSPARSCACHPDRQLVSGQRVLWWPVPDSQGAVNVYCEDGVQEADQS